MSVPQEALRLQPEIDRAAMIVLAGGAIAASAEAPSTSGQEQMPISERQADFLGEFYAPEELRGLSWIDGQRVVAALGVECAAVRPRFRSIDTKLMAVQIRRLLAYTAGYSDRRLGRAEGVDYKAISLGRKGVKKTLNTKVDPAVLQEIIDSRGHISTRIPGGDYEDIYVENFDLLAPAVIPPPAIKEESIPPDAETPRPARTKQPAASKPNPPTVLLGASGKAKAAAKASPAEDSAPLEVAKADVLGGKDQEEGGDEAVSETKPDKLDVQVSPKDPIRLYLKQISKVALLNAEQEVDLSKQIEAGLFAGHILVLRERGKRNLTPEETALRSRHARIKTTDLETLARQGEVAKRSLLEANLRLVVSIAKRYQGRGLDLPDLIQEGNLGLVRAVEKFDYTKGFKFSTYATWWLRQGITRAIGNQARTIRIPLNMVEQINKLNRVERQFLQDNGREATPEELAGKLDIAVEKVLEIQIHRPEAISLDTPIGDKNDSSLGDFVKDTDAAVAAEAVVYTAMQDELRAVLDMLDPREAQIVAMRYGLYDGEPKSLAQVAQVYNLPHARIRQIEREAMSKLRHPSRSRSLRDYA